MVFVNSQRIKVYKNDNSNSFLNRVASKFNTIPDYIILDPSPSISNMVENEDMKISLLDLLIMIKRDVIQPRSIDFGIFYSSLDQKFKDKLPILDIAKIWFSYNDKVIGNTFYIMTNKDSLKDKGLDLGFSLDEFFKNEEYKKIKKELSESIIKNKDKVKESDELYEEYNLLSSIPNTPFVIGTITYEIKTDLKNNILEVFDFLRVDPTFPFASIKKFYKVHKDFTPPPDWSESQEDVITLKVLTKKDQTDIDYEEDYNNILISKKKDGYVYLKFDFENKISDQERATLLQRALNLFDTNVNEVEQKQVELSGIFYIPKFKINKFVFSDLIMNNNLFSLYLVIDERLKTVKKKSGTFVYFNDPSNPQLGQITGTVITKVASDKDLTIRDISRELLPYGETYIRVNLTRAANLDAVDNFITVFTKLLTLYQSQEEEIIDFYRDYITDFGKDDKKGDMVYYSSKEGGKDLFIAGYGRQCGVKPIIIKESERKIWEGKDRPVVTFPKTAEEGEQNLYVCDSETHKYVGVMKNNLPNKDKYPFVPCCYVEPQTNKDNYKEYFEGVTKEKKDQKQQKLITTNKFMNLTGNVIGELPRKLKALFSILQEDENVEYFRKGVSDSANSFLECVLEGVNDKFSITTDLTFRNNFIKSEKQKLTKFPYLCKQQLYDKNLFEITDLISREDKYFNPRFFSHLLSEYYNCNIYIFERKYGSDQVEFLIQRNKNGLYQRFYPERRTIVIYEHWGSESDRAEYPRCELIVKWNKKFTEIKDYYHTSPDSEVINNFFYSSVIQNDNKNKDVKFLIRSENILSQYIDTYGKTRGLEIKVDRYKVKVLTTPLPILKNINLTDKLERQEIDLKIALECCSLLKLTNIQTCVNDLGQIIEISASSGNVLLYFPIKPIKTSLPYNNYQDPNFLEFNKKEYVKIYNYNKKLAKCLKSNFIYLYSVFLSEKNMTPSIESLLQFINDKIIVSPSQQYSSIINIQLSEGNGIIKNGKITVNSMEILKRLVYYTRVLSLRDTPYILGYKNHKTVDNFYQDSSDFKNYEGVNMITGSSSIINWKYNISTEIYDKIEPELNKYYYYNSALYENVDTFIAINKDSLEDGFSTIYKLKNIPNFNLVSQDDSGVLIIHPILDENNNNNPSDYTVFGYFYNTVKKYTFLIPL